MDTGQRQCPHNIITQADRWTSLSKLEALFYSARSYTLIWMLGWRRALSVQIYGMGISAAGSAMVSHFKFSIRNAVICNDRVTSNSDQGTQIPCPRLSALARDPMLPPSPGHWRHPPFWSGPWRQPLAGLHLEMNQWRLNSRAEKTWSEHIGDRALW